MNDALTPKPSILLVLCSWLVLAACIFSIALVIPLFAETWNPFTMIGGVILLPLPVFLGGMQYRGVFRASASAAYTTSMLLFAVLALALLIFAMELSVLLSAGIRRQVLFVLGQTLVLALLCGTAGWLNLIWSRRLKALGDLQTPTVATPYYSLRELLAAVTVIAIVTALSTHFIRSTPPQYAENVSRDQAPFNLPLAAHNISYCQGFRGMNAYEFTIDEAGFVDWVKSGIGSLESQAANISVEPITTPFSVSRFYSLTPNVAGPDTITITDGLYYYWSEEDREVRAAYDRNTGRAYYSAHFH